MLPDDLVDVELHGVRIAAIMGPMTETRIDLPSYVKAPVGVFLNGVPLTDDDFTVVGSTLVIKRELVKEGRLGFWRWFLGAWGIGTYRRNDVVDVRYTRDGAAKILHDVEFEGASAPRA